jgi:hypothetical protein
MRQDAFRLATPAQHPLSEPPTISAGLAEPPSEVDTSGGQTVLDEWLAAAATKSDPSATSRLPK